MAFDPTGTMLATGDAAGRLKLWSCATLTLLNEFALPGSISGFSFHPLGTFLGISLEHSSPHVLHFPSLRMQTLGDPRDLSETACIGVDPSSNMLVTGTLDKLMFWDLEKGPVAQHGAQAVSAVALDKHRLVAAVGYNKWLASSDEVAPPTIVAIDHSRAEPKTTELVGHDRGSIGTLALSRAGCLLASGGDDGRVGLWNLNTGARLALINAHGGSVTGVAFTSDERFLVSFGMDAALRLWELPELRLALTFVSVEDDEYVAVADSGAYACSRGGLRSVIFRCGASAYSFDQFDASLNQPDAILRRYGSAPPEAIESLALARQARLRRLGTQDAVAVERPPRLEFDGPAPPRVTADGALPVRLHVYEGDRAVRRLLVSANDVPIFGARGLDLAPIGGLCSVSIPLAQGDARLQVAAVDEAGTESLRLTWRTARSTPASKRTLHVIAVGVSLYTNESLRLELAAKDARDLSQAFYRRATRFDDTRVTLLLDSAATRDSVLGIEALLRRTTIDDQVVLFFAGHGVTQGGMYYFLPTDVDTAHVAESGVSIDDLFGLLDTAPARRRLILLDSCHTGEPDGADGPKAFGSRGIRRDIVIEKDHSSAPRASANVPLISELFGDLRRDTGAFVLGAARAGEGALELSTIGNGLFTAGVLRAFSDGVNGIAANDLRVSHLRDAATAFVKEASRGAQHPVVLRENIEDDFLLF
jgi:hypothetical protein